MIYANMLNRGEVCIFALAKRVCWLKLMLVVGHNQGEWTHFTRVPLSDFSDRLTCLDDLKRIVDDKIQEQPS